MRDMRHLNSTFDPTSLKIVIDSETNTKGSVITVRSKRTGKDYTFKIKRSKYRNTWYTHVYVEKEYLRFVHIGTYFKGKIFKKRVHVNTPASLAIEWVLRNIDREMFDSVRNNVELFHIGKCIKCGKALTDSESIERGLGPVCAGSVNY